MEKVKCPLSGVHNRLGEVHKFWHDMLSDYQKPEDFRISLNAAIQALRNVTFILQSNRTTIQNFDQWYGRYQDAMKADEVLKWLHQARNVIVKQEDLELHSIANARVRAWSDVSRLEFQVSPFITTEQIAKDLVRLHVVKAPKPIADHAILNVERRWAVNDLPKHELLDVIAHGYKFFENLISDAHQQAGIDLEACNAIYGPKHENPFTSCMSVTRDDRSANIKLSTQELFPKVEFDHINRESVKYKESVSRYSRIEPPLPRRVDDLFEFVKVINERAKQMLVMDKGHQTIFIFCYPNGSYNPLQMRADSKSEQFVLIRSVADQVKRTGANGVIAISEVWVILESERNGYRLAGEHPNREEALQVSAVSKNKVAILNTFFSRDKDGNIILGGTHEMEPQTFALMQPIIEALNS
jgi:hypothetical protein